MRERSLAVLLAATLSTSCGLIDSDVTRFDLNLPKKDFKLDTADWKLKAEGTLPAVMCPATDCSAAVDSFCETGACASECSTAGTCDVLVKVSVFQMFNLDLESPELDAIDNQPVIDVTVDTVDFNILTNTLNVATPPLTVFMAPQGVSDPASAEAVEIGTIASIPAGQAGVEPLVLTEAGRVSMKGFLDNYKAPFNIIVAGTVVVKAGDPVPTGRLAGQVEAKAFVSP
jgi:hypothetical protein